MQKNDPLMLLARQRVIKLSADLEVQLASKIGSAPAIEILHRLRERAAESLAALIVVNLFTEEGRAQALALQNEVKRYDEWFAAIKEIIAEGIQEDKNMRDSEREEMLDILSQTADGEQLAKDLGLIDSPEIARPD